MFTDQVSSWGLFLA